MIKPSELLKAASDYKHYVFYGMKWLPEIEYQEKFRNGDIGVLDLSKIEWINFQMETCSAFNYSKAIASICTHPNANFIAKVLDKYCRVNNFCEEDGTLYIYCEVK